MQFFHILKLNKIGIYVLHGPFFSATAIIIRFKIF